MEPLLRLRRKTPQHFQFVILKGLPMKPREDNPALFRENVYKSWKVMAHVVKQIKGECWVAHLEPNPGVGYDCLSLIVKDSDGHIQVPFMMNRNGVNSNRLDKIWAKVADEGHVAVAEELIAICQLPKSGVPRDTGITRVCDRVVEWIGQHVDQVFYVGPLHWPGSCETRLDIPYTDEKSDGWPIPDNGPDISLGINRVEVERLVQRQLTVSLKMSDKESKKLSLSISSCDNFLEIVSGGDNSCRKVVEWQYTKHDPEEVRTKGLKTVLHRPEPWAGNLLSAPIMFLSSNPSFDPRENFPTLDWDDQDAADFFVNRFSERTDRGYGAIDGPEVAQQDRAILKDGAMTGRVKTWYTLRSRAAVLLEKSIDDTRAASDYVMSEVVHCKSHNEDGVFEALPACVSKWFQPILEASSAKLVIVSGEPAGRAVKQAIEQVTPAGDGLPQTWGSWKGKDPANGRWPKSWPELDEWIATGEWSRRAQDEHICTVKIQFAARERRFTFMWMPHPVRSVPQKIEDTRLYDSETLERLRSIVRD